MTFNWLEHFLKAFDLIWEKGGTAEPHCVTSIGVSSSQLMFLMKSQ